MLTVRTSAQYRRDLRNCAKQGLDVGEITRVINTLRIPAPLPPKNRDHGLVGQYAGYRECHIQPDWLLVYRVDERELYLYRIGTHSDLFGR